MSLINEALQRMQRWEEIKPAIIFEDAGAG